jgi:hypothetical protein
MEFIENKKNNANSIDLYMNEIAKRVDKFMVIPEKQIKISNDEPCVPTINNYQEIMNYNYNLTQLKYIAKKLKIKVGGNKAEILKRIFLHLHLSKKVIKIQKKFRSFLQKRFNYFHGPAFLNHKLCTNSTDFVSMDPVEDIEINQFISYKDIDGFIYGFDIVSLHNMICNAKKLNELRNPYNRNMIPDYVIENMKKIIKISRVMKIPVNLHIEDDSLGVSNEKAIELRALTLFQNIDALGNYSNPAWFLSLNRNELIKLVRELIDIWDYRAQLTNATKSTICPPFGNPFRNVNVQYMYNESDLNNVRKMVLVVLENFVNTGVDNDAKSLGAFYVLGSLTLVNGSAALALPWLFQSMSYF